MIALTLALAAVAATPAMSTRYDLDPGEAHREIHTHPYVSVFDTQEQPLDGLEPLDVYAAQLASWRPPGADQLSLVRLFLTPPHLAALRLDGMDFDVLFPLVVAEPTTLAGHPAVRLTTRPAPDMPYGEVVVWDCPVSHQRLQIGFVGVEGDLAAFLEQLPDGALCHTDAEASQASDRGPEVKRQVKPEAPKGWRGPEQVCRVRIQVDVAGQPIRVEPLDCPDPALLETTREALLKWAFYPARCGGERCASEIGLNIRYTR